MKSLNSPSDDKAKLRNSISSSLFSATSLFSSMMFFLYIFLEFSCLNLHVFFLQKILICRNFDVIYSILSTNSIHLCYSQNKIFAVKWEMNINVKLSYLFFCYTLAAPWTGLLLLFIFGNSIMLITKPIYLHSIAQLLILRIRIESFRNALRICQKRCTYLY